MLEMSSFPLFLYSILIEILLDGVGRQEGRREEGKKGKRGSKEAIEIRNRREEERKEGKRGRQTV